MNKLLKILSQCGRFSKGDIPKNARTLLHTPRHVASMEKCGGHLVYFGLQHCIMELASQILTAFDDTNVLLLDVNIDGLPIHHIHHSNNLSFWPILCAFW